MPRGRHKHAKATPRARGVARIAVPVALITAAPVGAVVTSDDSTDLTRTLTADPLPKDGIERAASPSRGGRRPPPVPVSTPTVSISGAETAEPKPTDEATSEPTPTDEPSPEPTVDGYMFTTAGLNVREGASTDTEVISVVARATELALTGVTDGAWVQVLIDGEVAWVHGDYLSEEEPPPEEGGISYEPCPLGSDIEASLTQDAIRVYRAVCARFPSVNSYGGYRSGGGEHSEGRAVDIMISSSAQGDQIAAWVRENYQVLGVSEVIWSQQIWTVERSSDGWRWMEDRGSATANHYDHVHVTVYGNSGG